MLLLDDVREIAKSLHISQNYHELKERFNNLYDRTLKAYSRLTYERQRHLDEIELYFNAPKQKMESKTIGDYWKAYYNFINLMTELSQLAFDINNKKVEA